MVNRFVVGVLGLGLSLAIPAWGCNADCSARELWGRAYVMQNIRYLDSYPGLQPAGYKLGLGSAAAQQRFASDRPVFGLLPPAALVLRREYLSAASFTRGMIEAELAFRLKQRIDQPVSSVAALKQLVDVVAPAFELPDLGALGAEPDPFQLVVISVAASRFYIGAPSAIAEVNPDGLRVRMSYEGGELVDERASSVMGGQWQALLALVNNRVASGWSIGPEQWLLTGSIGGMFPLKAGSYKASFGSLGKIELEVAK